MIMPARDGALRVLRAARDAGVKRVVLTSSFAAIGYGAKGRTNAFTEEDWTNPNDPSLQPYQKSKTIAERAAWDFIAREGGKLELAVVNPVGVFGPVLGPDYSTSIVLAKRLLDGAMPGCPDNLVRHSRCPRRRRTAPQDDDPPRCTRRTVSRHRWGLRERS
jgi:nucleoside-diphosphate-sugar epimerase